MASLTVLSNMEDHPNLLPMTPNGTPTTFLLTTSISSSQTTSSPTATSRGTVSKIAPKRQRQDSTDATGENGSNQTFRSKRRSVQGLHRGSAAPAVARRNERERNRVRQVNLGFATLRQHVPNGAKSKKMSKVETLRSAVQYIKQLQQLLNDKGDDVGMDDENSIPSFDDQFRPHHQSQHTLLQTNGHHVHGFGGSGSSNGHVHIQTAAGSTMGFGGLTSPPCSAASSPTPSLGSDASSPYDSLSPEDEELLDFTTWLS